MLVAAALLVFPSVEVWFKGRSRRRLPGAFSSAIFNRASPIGTHISSHHFYSEFFVHDFLQHHCSGWCEYLKETRETGSSLRGQCSRKFFLSDYSSSTASQFPLMVSHHFPSALREPPAILVTRMIINLLPRSPRAEPPAPPKIRP